MRITFIAFGTRGDVQPAIALGKALRARGHSVRLIASANFRGWIESHGLEAAPAAHDVQNIMLSEGGHDWIENGNNPIRQLQIMRQLLDEHGFDMIMDAWQGCQGAEVIISSFTSYTFAVTLARQLNAHHICILLQPAMQATRSRAVSMGSPLPDGLLNYLFGKLLIEPTPWRLYGNVINRFRQTALNLPPETQAENQAALRATPTLLGYSPQVAPHPPDWPPTVHTTGYWFLDETTAWIPPPTLLQFLNSSPPPIYIGFGSMTGRDVAGFNRLLVEAIRQSEQRAVLLTGWAGYGAGDLPPTIFRLDSAPHHWLFPRVAAVVHHGGAGTTAAAIRAGVPQVIVPHMADQPYWGERIWQLGIGPQPIPRPRLTAANLAQAIRAATADLEMQRRARELGEHVRAEDGVGAAVKLIEDYGAPPTGTPS